MAEITKREICRCVHCGNEAEMVFTCTLSDAAPPPDASLRPAAPRKVKASGTCSHCGNEADMWIDL